MITRLTLALLFLVFINSFGSTDSYLFEKNSELLKKQPVKFRENMGQMTTYKGRLLDEVLFKTEAPGVNVWITKSGLIFQTFRVEENEMEESSFVDKLKEKIGLNTKDDKLKTYWERVDLELVGGEINPKNIVKEGAGVTDFNYYLTHCPDGIFGVKEYDKIIIKDVYPGIDWVFYNSDEKGFKYDFVVHPGADYRLIELQYKSKKPILLNHAGELVMNTQYGLVKESRPVSYIQKNEIATRFVLKEQNKIRVNNDIGYSSKIKFQVDSDEVLNLTEDLYIDPQLKWGTVYTGNEVDGPMSADTDINGNLFITGYTGSSDFPVANPGGGAYFQGTNTYRNIIGFVVKFSNAGVRLWSTYYGSTSSMWGTYGNAIKTDASGNIFIAGKAGSGLPVFNPGGATYYQAASAGGNSDVLILKFNNNGVRQWATYYGGNGVDEAKGVCVDNSGNVFITGVTQSTNFPTMNPGAGAFFQSTAGTFNDMFILKFTNAGVRQWATYYGGNNTDNGFAICTDATGNVFVAGNSMSTNLTTLNPGGGAYYQAANAGSFDAVILKFTNSGVLQWSTYYGDVNSDACASIAADNNGNVFVSGTTSSPAFPLLNPGGGAFYQGTIGGNSDEFMLKFNNSGVRSWCTFIGGTGTETNGSYDNMVIDKCGNVYISFVTRVGGLPYFASCDGGYLDTSATGSGGSFNIDHFIMMFNNTGMQRWGTYVGGDGMNDIREPLALDNNNNLFMVGEWWPNPSQFNTATFPLLNPGGGAYFDTTFSFGDMGFVLKFTPPPVNALLNVTSTPSCSNPCSGVITASVAATGTCNYTYLWSSGQTTQTVTGLCLGTYSVTITNEFCEDTTLSIILTGNPGLPPNANAGSNQYISCLTNTVTLSGSSTTPGAIPSWVGPGIFSGGSTFNPLVNQPGTYTLTVTDTSTGCVNIATVSVLTNTLAPVISSTPAYTLTCTQTTTTLTVLSSATGPTVLWSGPGIVSGGSTYTPVVNQPGTYTISVTDTSNGCTSIDTVQVYTSNSLLVTAGSAQVLTCKDTVAVVSASANSSTTTMQWSGSGIISGVNTFSATVNSSGTYSITVTDTLTGCTSFAIVSVTTNTTLVANAGSNHTLNCLQSTANLNGSSSSNDDSVLWAGPGIVSGLNSYTPVVNAPGNYTITVIDTITGCVYTNTVAVTIDTSVTANAGVNITINQGASTTLIGTGGGTYSWFPSSGLSCTNCSNPIAAPEATTTYTLIVTNSANGCTDTSYVTVTVLEVVGCNGDLSVNVPTAFSPNGDGENDALKIYVNQDCFKNYWFAVFNRWGELVFETTSADITWDGTYRKVGMNAAVFTYTFLGNGKDGSTVVKKGNISLVK